MSSIWTVRRSASDTKLSGLCAGIAQHWGVDPTIVRVGAVLLALSGGLGLVLYAAGWLLLPVEGKDRAPVEDLFGGQLAKWPKELWVAIVIAACILMLTAAGPLIPFGIGPAIVLAAIWYFGYYRNRPGRTERAAESGSVGPAGWTERAWPFNNSGGASPQTDSSSAESTQPAAAQNSQFYQHQGPTTPFTEAAKAWQERIEQHQRIAAGQEPAPSGWRLPDPGQSGFLADPDPVGLYTDPPTGSGQAGSGRANELEQAKSRRVSRADSPSARRLRLSALVVLGLTLSTLVILDSAGVLSVGVASYFGAALLIAGLTLVAAAWRGRARGILPVAVILLIGTIASAVSGPLAQVSSWDNSSLTYHSSTELPASDVRDTGQLKIDLHGLQVAQDTSYTVHLDNGLLTVKLPEDANVAITWSVGSGAFVQSGSGSGPQNRDENSTENEHDFKAGNDLRGSSIVTGSDPQGPQLTLTVSLDRGRLELQR